MADGLELAALDLVREAQNLADLLLYEPGAAVLRAPLARAGIERRTLAVKGEIQLRQGPGHTTEKERQCALDLLRYIAGSAGFEDETRRRLIRWIEKATEADLALGIYLGAEERRRSAEEVTSG